jgi:hypothetical protein
VSLLLPIMLLLLLLLLEVGGRLLQQPILPQHQLQRGLRLEVLMQGGILCSAAVQAALAALLLLLLLLLKRLLPRGAWAVNAAAAGVVLAAV